MAELQSPSNGFNSVDWLDRPSSMHGSSGMSYQQSFGSSDATPATSATGSSSPSNTNDRYQGYYNTQLPPIITTAATTASPSVAAMATQMSHDDASPQSHSMLDHSQDDLDSRRSSYSNNNNSWMLYPSRDNSTASTMSQDPVAYHQNHGQPTPSPSGSIEKSSQPKRHRTPSTKDIHVEKNTEGKPPYSYATLIKYAIENSPHKKLTLSEIYQWVIEHYPYYSTAGTGWKNSIRHNLSLNKSFVRVARPINEPGKGSYWIVDYRAAEAEHRSRYSISSMRGRNSRSGSDPAPSPYRAEAWSSSMNNRRYRDGRSLSADANAAKANSLSSAVTAANPGNYGYYGTPYAYSRHFSHYHHHSHMQRPVSNLSRSHSGPCAQQPGASNYDVYLDGTMSNQHYHHHHAHHHAHHQHHTQSVSGNSAMEPATPVPATNAAYGPMYANNSTGHNYGQNMYAAYAYGGAGCPAHAPDEMHHPLSRSSQLYQYSPASSSTGSHQTMMTPPSSSPASSMSWSANDMQHHHQQSQATLAHQQTSYNGNPGSSSALSTAPDASQQQPQQPQAQQDDNRQENASESQFATPQPQYRRAPGFNNDDDLTYQTSHSNSAAAVAAVAAAAAASGMTPSQPPSPAYSAESSQPTAAAAAVAAVAVDSKVHYETAPSPPNSIWCQQRAEEKLRGKESKPVIMATTNANEVVAAAAVASLDNHPGDTFTWGQVL